MVKCACGHTLLLAEDDYRICPRCGRVHRQGTVTDDMRVRVIFEAYDDGIITEEKAVRLLGVNRHEFWRLYNQHHIDVPMVVLLFIGIGVLILLYLITTA